MNEEKIKKIFADEAFVKELLSLDAAEEIQTLLKTKGIELDLDQIEKAKALVAKNLRWLKQAKNWVMTNLTKFQVVLQLQPLVWYPPLSLLLALHQA